MSNTIEQIRTRASTGAFTLVEVLISSVLMALALVALMTAFGSSTAVTQKTEEIARAGFLADQIRELLIALPFSDLDGTPAWGLESGESAGYPFDDLDDVAGTMFSPPILSDGSVISDLTGWSQIVSMQSVNETNFNQAVTNGSASVVRVSVVVQRGDQVLAELAWLVFDLGDGGSYGDQDDDDDGDDDDDEDDDDEDD
jgi:type II secretory pathway pseudopilin PulG